jgi:hypothetical protein
LWTFADVCNILTNIQSIQSVLKARASLESGPSVTESLLINYVRLMLFLTFLALFQVSIFYLKMAHSIRKFSIHSCVLPLALLFASPSFPPSVRSSFCQSIRPSYRPSFRPSFLLSFRPTVCLSFCLDFPYSDNIIYEHFFFLNPRC